MARFSRYNNPSKRKKPKRKADYNDRMIMACKSMMIDEKLGYELPESYYKEAYNLNK